MTKFALRVKCTSRRGIVAAVSTYLAGQGCNITDSAQFDDAETGNFFMRISFVSEDRKSLQGYCQIKLGLSGQAGLSRP